MPERLPTAYAAATDVGMKRDHNEDSFLVNEGLGLFVVADGMGGHAGGETASKLAVQSIERELQSAKLRPDNPFESTAPLAETPLADAFRDAVESACAAIHDTAKLNPQLEGMGTTTVGLLVFDHAALVGHVGDSRAYLFRGADSVQITEDHSLVNEQVLAGLLTKEEAKVSRFKNIITRSVGFEEDVLVDIMGIPLRPGDVFVLCSDGLANLVEMDEIGEMVRSHPLAEVSQRLVDLANARGGDDNITVVAVKVG